MTARQRPAENGGERETLAGMLDFLRATVIVKVDGLTDADPHGNFRAGPTETLGE
ncbi:hypothetical protein [Actinoplanes sp. NPDC051411]|uniref:hypothetical protein n=1 Tax=Actinoplanes sp. NPDC051411 TaxID=3155522 RepID=UPI003424E1B3